MSHVSENALELNRDCDDLRLDFQEYIGSSRPNQLSEIAAYFIFDSPAFLEFLRLADNLAPQDLPAMSDTHTRATRTDAYREAMKKLVIGKQIDDEYPLLHELISGPFDADKLDYMTRDANMCGVPVVTDVTRLVRKVRLASVGSDDLPPEIGRTVEQARATYSIIGIARSGARTLDELALGRALMFDKIYRHQKVRAAESMVASLVYELLQIKSIDAAMLPFRLVDEDLYTLSRANAKEVLGLPSDIVPNSVEDSHLRVAIDLAARLRDRQLLVRGFAFSSKMPMDPYRNEPDQHAGVDRLNRLAKNPSERQAFVHTLVQLATEIAELTGEPIPASMVPGGRVEPYVWISGPRAADGSGEANQIGHAWLLGEYGEPIRRADQDYAETRGWSDAYVATRDLGLIFCPQEIAPCIYLAAEVLVFERFNVRTPDTMRAFAKQDPLRLRGIQKKLMTAGWYRDRHRDLAPEPDVLHRGDANLRIEKILTNLQSYSGPLTVNPDTNKRQESSLTKVRVRSYLKQFDHDLVDAAIEMLTAIRYIGRDDVNEALDAFLSANPEFAAGSIAPLGQPKDSSSVLTYYAGDVARKHQSVLRRVEAALLHSGPIVMIDDFVGRGSAAITIFEDWLGAESSQSLGQERAEPLPENAKNLLKQAKIALVFVAGLPEGARAIETRARELGLDNVITYVHMEGIPTLFDDDVIANPRDRERLVEFCREIGREGLLAEGRDPVVADERALGYGNRGFLLVSSYNTPTAALTCLWHDAPRWSALLPRRPKS